MSPISRRHLAALTALAGVGVLAGCASGDPLGTSTPAASTSGSAGSGAAALVVGSQQYYSNEIIAELYAQALEKAGYTVERQFQIGQREVYLPELEAAKIDVLPEYSGNLLQYYDKKATAKRAGRALAAAVLLLYGFAAGGAPAGEQATSPVRLPLRHL